MLPTLLEAAILCVLRKTPQLHARPITDQVIELLGEERQRQAIATTLKRMEQGGLLASTMGRVHGAGHQSRIFDLTQSGSEALKAFVDVAAEMLEMVTGAPTQNIFTGPSAEKPQFKATEPVQAPRPVASHSTESPSAPRSFSVGPLTAPARSAPPDPILERVTLPASFIKFPIRFIPQVTLDNELEDNIRFLISEYSKRIPPYINAAFDVATYESLSLDLEDAVESTREGVRFRFKSDNVDPNFQYSVWSDFAHRTFAVVVGDRAFQAEAAKLLNAESNAAQANWVKGSPSSDEQA